MSWAQDAMFYHIYPLGLCGAPERNDFTSAPVPRLESLSPWIDHIAALNLNAVYLGPLFESTRHGYDTADYFQVDRRLGDEQTLKRIVGAMKARGLRVILDGVFNHVGRDFWAFRDVQANGRDSPYVGWFHSISFDGRSPLGDPFSYEGWAGHHDLVKLNLKHPEVREHLFRAVEMWIREFAIDGLRLDAADVMDHDFLRALAEHCRHLRPDFWLMGEVVHGDYRQWAHPQMLDATTNYEAYKSLYSSHADRNYFEIAYTLNRQFGSGGLYRGLPLYAFADNHDVSRVASKLTHSAHLYPLHILLFTIPGVPSIYYGSEWGIAGIRTDSSDRMLRPCLRLDPTPFPEPELAECIRRLAALRRDLPALRTGDYEQLYVASEQFAFARRTADQTIIVAVNASAEELSIPLRESRPMFDLLNGEPVDGGRVTLHPYWGAVVVLESERARTND